MTSWCIFWDGRHSKRSTGCHSPCWVTRATSCARTGECPVTSSALSLADKHMWLTRMAECSWSSTTNSSLRSTLLRLWKFCKVKWGCDIDRLPAAPRRPSEYIQCSVCDPILPILFRIAVNLVLRSRYVTFIWSWRAACLQFRSSPRGFRGGF